MKKKSVRFEEDLAEGVGEEADAVSLTNIRGVAQDPEIPASQAPRPITIAKSSSKVPRILHTSDKDC